jgi:hypothetical protein
LRPIGVRTAIRMLIAPMAERSRQVARNPRVDAA